MARDVFRMTLTTPVTEPDLALPVLEPLSGIQVSVYKRGSTLASDLVQVFQRPTGTAEGPTPETGATGGPNPFTTGTTGHVEFWCNGPAELDVVIHDTQAPSRIPDRTFGWNVMPAAAGSLPTSALAQDGGLTLAALAADVKRQMCPVGQVIDWWRPADTVPLPPGFVICDGSSIAEGQHDFPVAGAINVPDLRNMFILGADATKARAQGANLGNAPTDAPGLAGTGGSMTHQLTATESGVPVHAHADTFAVANAGAINTGTESADHSHAISVAAAAPNAGHPYAPTSNYGWSGEMLNYLSGSGWKMAQVPDAGGISYANLTHSHSASAGGRSAAHYHQLPAHGHGLNGTVTNNAAANAAAAHNNTPRFIGLLKLMKVRYA